MLRWFVDSPPTEAVPVDRQPFGVQTGYTLFSGTADDAVLLVRRLEAGKADPYDVKVAMIRKLRARPPHGAQQSAHPVTIGQARRL